MNKLTKTNMEHELADCKIMQNVKVPETVIKQEPEDWTRSGADVSDSYFAIKSEVCCDNSDMDRLSGDKVESFLEVVKQEVCSDSLKVEPTNSSSVDVPTTVIDFGVAYIKAEPPLAQDNVSQDTSHTEHNPPASDRNTVLTTNTGIPMKQSQFAPLESGDMINLAEVYPACLPEESETLPSDPAESPPFSSPAPPCSASPAVCPPATPPRPASPDVCPPTPSQPLLAPFPLPLQLALETSQARTIERLLASLRQLDLATAITLTMTLETLALNAERASDQSLLDALTPSATPPRPASPDVCPPAPSQPLPLPLQQALETSLAGTIERLLASLRRLDLATAFRVTTTAETLVLNVKRARDGDSQAGHADPLCAPATRDHAAPLLPQRVPAPSQPLPP